MESKPTNSKRLRDDTARLVAEIAGVSTGLVNKVRIGDRNNDNVMAILVDFTVQKHFLIERFTREEKIRKALTDAGYEEEINRMLETVDLLNEGYKELLNLEHERCEKLIKHITAIIPITKKANRYARKKN